jgi:hypothetical protein
MISKKLLGMKRLTGADMNLRFAFSLLALAISMLAMPATSDAAGALRGRFSVDGIANCQNPPISNIPLHAEGTAELSADRNASLQMSSNVEGQVNLNAKLGGRPQEAPGGSASLHVAGRHTLKAVRDYPNNQMIVFLTIIGNSCTMKVENRLKPGRSQYTFTTTMGLAYCSKPIVTRAECQPF